MNQAAPPPPSSSTDAYTDAAGALYHPDPSDLYGPLSEQYPLTAPQSVSLAGSDVAAAPYRRQRRRQATPASPFPAHADVPIAHAALQLCRTRLQRSFR